MKEDYINRISNFKLHLFKYAALTCFSISIYLSIRWCEYPLLINNRILEFLFISTKRIDASILNLTTGYFTGYLVYVFTVAIPTVVKNQLFAKHASDILVSNYNQSVYLLFLIVKSISTEAKWNSFINKQTDLECFGDNFYTAIEQFNIQAEAQSLLKKNDAPLFWYEYLELNFKEMYEKTENILLKYHSYLPNDFLNCIYKWKKSSLIDIILGNGNRSENLWQDNYLTFYKENFPLSMYYKQLDTEEIPIPFFCKENQTAIKEFISILEETYRICKKHLTTSDKQTDAKHTIKLFKTYNIGLFNTSVYNQPLV